MKGYLKIEINHLLGSLLIFVPIGYLLQQIPTAIAVALVAYFAKHGYYLIKLAYLINRRFADRSTLSCGYLGD